MLILGSKGVRPDLMIILEATLPGYVLLTASMKFSSNPATMAPPTGTRKFLSVLWIKASTRPILAACKAKTKLHWNCLPWINADWKLFLKNSHSYCPWKQTSPLCKQLKVPLSCYIISDDDHIRGRIKIKFSSFRVTNILISLTAKIWLWISPLAAIHFHVNQWQEFGVRSKQQLLLDKFEYSHYLFAG